MSNKNINDLIFDVNKNLGSAPKSFELNNSYFRFDLKKQNDKAGWIIGSRWSYQGQEYFAATYGSWQTGEAFTFLSWDKKTELENPSLKKDFKILQKKSEQENLKIQEKNKEKILRAFKTCEPLKSNDNHYLLKKQVSVFSGLYQDKKNNLVVPIYLDFKKSIHGYQYITPLEKKFPVGQTYKNCFFYFGNLLESSCVYIAEGIATAATVHEVTGLPTFCAFSSGNIPNVAKKIKNELSGKNIIIACDNDKNGVGYKFALKAKKKLGNIEILKPKFSDEITELSDFNDLFVSQGLDETKKQLSFDPNEFIQVDFLGFSENTYYFYSSRKKYLSSFSFEKIRNGALEELAPSSYWAQRFTPVFDKNDEPTSNCNWKKSSEKIAEIQQAVGFFSSSSVRGLGSWFDEDDLILNLGNKVLLNGDEKSFGKIKTKFYLPSKNKLEIKKNPSYDFSKITKALALIDFESERDALLVGGYLVFSQIFSTQKWRPHLWIRAEKGSGKSSLLQFLNSMILNSQIFQDSTSAGLRQTIKGDSRVCLIDEAEGESYKTKQVLELARQSSSGSGTTIARGTVNGDGFSYSPELSFVFASIRPPELTPADESRIINIYLKKPDKHDPQKNDKRVSAFYAAKGLALDLFSVMNQKENLVLFFETTKKMHQEILELGFDPRFADQYAAILTGYLFLDPDKDPSDLVKKTIYSDQNDIKSFFENSDDDDFRDVLLQTVIKIGQAEKSIEQVFAEYMDLGPEYKKNFDQELGKYGIFYLKNLNQFCFTNNNHLKNIVARVSNYKNYYASFQKNKNFEYSNFKKNGALKRCYKLLKSNFL